MTLPRRRHSLLPAMWWSRRRTPCRPASQRLARYCWLHSATSWSTRPIMHRRPAGHALSRRSPTGMSCCSPPLSPVDSAGHVQRALLLIFLLPRYPRVDQAATKDESSAPAPAAGAQPTADPPGAAHRRRLTGLGAAMTRRGRRSVGTSDARTGASTAHHLWHPKAPTHRRPCPKSAAGRSRRKVQPSPGTVSSSRRPPWPWAMAAAMARPRPLPPWLRERAGSAR